MLVECTEENSNYYYTNGKKICFKNTYLCPNELPYLNKNSHECMDQIEPNHQTNDSDDGSNNTLVIVLSICIVIVVIAIIIVIIWRNKNRNNNNSNSLIERIQTVTKGELTSKEKD